MELFRFIVWQWNRFDFEELTLLFAAILTVAEICIGIYLTLGLGMILLYSLMTFVCSVTAGAIVYNIRLQWWKYKKERDQEAQKIVDRLRGVR